MSVKNLLDELLEIDPKTSSGNNTNGTAIVSAVTPKVPVVVKDSIVVPDDAPVSPQDDDMAFARIKMRKMIAIAEDATSELAQIAADTQQPRAYEVLANLLKTTSEATRDLLGTHKTKAEIARLNNAGQMSKFEKFDSEHGGINTGNQINVEKAVFVGTAADLLDAVEQQKKKTITNE
jgi:hypothetical protein